MSLAPSSGLVSCLFTGLFRREEKMLRIWLKFNSAKLFFGPTTEQIDKKPKVEKSQLKTITNIRNCPSWKYAKTVAGIIITPKLYKSATVRLDIHWSAYLEYELVDWVSSSQNGDDFV